MRIQYVRSYSLGFNLDIFIGSKSGIRKEIQTFKQLDIGCQVEISYQTLCLPSI